MADFKQILSQRKNRMALLILAPLGILAIVLLWQSGILAEFWPGRELLEKESSELKKLQATLQKELNEAATLKHQRDLFASQSKDFWVPQRDGKAETDAQKAVEQAARLASVKLSTLGDIRNSKINDKILLMDLSVACTDSMENISRFLAELYRSNPRFYWQRCTLRPDNQRDSKKIVLNGNIRFIAVNDDDTGKLLTGGLK